MLTRRQFMINSGAFGASLLASPLTLGDRLLPQDSGYRALVCINLAGGNDSFNMLVPSDECQYAAYSNARGNLALDRNNLIDLTNRAVTGSSFSVHSGMSEVQELYDKGDAAFVANVGALDRPISRAELKSRLNIGPEQLLSHTGQIYGWQAGSPDLQSSSGWGGRTADLLQHFFPSANSPVSVSMSGVNLFQLGSNTLPCICQSSNMYSSISEYSVGVDFDYVTRQLAEEGYRNAHGTSLSWPETNLNIDSKTRFEAYNERENYSDLRLNFGQDNFSQQLSRVAHILSEQDPTKPVRQIFYVSFSGWDHHHQLLKNQAMMLPVLSQGLLSFRNALSDLGLFESVITFTVSEFGRSLTSNGSGSDHGWGGHQIVMGGGVRGGQVYGRYPKLSPLNPLNIGNGVYVPTTSNDQYFAKLALWLGVPLSKINYVLPNFRAFKSSSKLGDQSFYL
jgi:uncharacterized protein (DUF1501 family)